MSVECFQKRLGKHLRRVKVELIVNENRTTMLNLLDRRPFRARVSVHKMFLDAPDEIIAAIAHYVRANRPDRAGHSQRIRNYIQENLARFDYSDRLRKEQLVHTGRIYDLKEIYTRVNEAYFEGSLELAVTWYGNWGRTNRRRVTFGQYLDQLKLVKLHRILDDPFFPEYFVEFVMYHEMVHHVVRGHVDANGRYRYHCSAFREMERRFAHYEKALAWERAHKDHFFRK